MSYTAIRLTYHPLRIRKYMDGYGIFAAKRLSSDYAGMPMEGHFHVDDDMRKRSQLHWWMDCRAMLSAEWMLSGELMLPTSL